MNSTNILCSLIGLRTIYVRILVIFFLSTPPALAENRDAEGPYVKLLGGVNFALEDDFEGSDEISFPSGDASFDPGYLAGLTAGYRVNESLAFELECLYRSNEVDKLEANGQTLANGGDLASVTFMANALYFPPLFRTVSPYIGGGFGWIEEIDLDIDYVSGEEQNELEDSVFALQAMLGVEIPIEGGWRMLAEGRYLASPGPELSNSEGNYDFDYNNLSLNFGIQYQF